MGKKWGKQVTQVTTIILLLSLMITNSIKTVESQADEATDEQVFVYRFWSFMNTSVTPLSWNYIENSWIGPYWFLLNSVGASLYQKDANNSGPDHDFIPQLAVDLPTISNDGLTYTVTLKEGLKFSNGNSLTAEDLIFSYNLYATPAVSEQKYSDLVSVLGSNSSLTKLDDHTVQFQFLEDSVFNFEILSGYPIIESKPEYIDKYNNCNSGVLNDCVFDFSGDDVFTGAGPYMIDSHDFANHEIQLIKNPYYHDNEVWADRLIFQGVRRGNFDNDFNATAIAEDHVADLISLAFNPALLEVWEKPHPYVLYNWPHAQVMMMPLNFLHPIFGTGEAIPLGPLAESDNNIIQARHVRTAFSYLMDRDYMSFKVWGGAGISTSSLIPQTATGYNTSQEVHQFSLDTAKSHLEMAGFDYDEIIDSNRDGDYSDENDTRFFNFTLFNLFDNPDRAQYIEYITPLFAKAGIGLNTQPDNPGKHIWWGNKTLIPTYEAGGFDAVMFMAVYAQPFSFGHQYSTTGLCDVDDDNLRCWNIGGYQNAFLDSLIYQFDNEGNYTIRTSLLPQIQAILTEDLPAIPIVFGNSPVPIKKDVIMPNAKYADSKQLRWELVRKEGWELPTEGGDDEDQLDLSSTNVTIIVAVVAVVVIAGVVMRRKP